MFERSLHDRRQCKAKSRFPVIDSKGVLVREERRMQADRRLSGIQAEWSEMICDAEQPSDQKAQPKQLTST